MSANVNALKAITQALINDASALAAMTRNRLHTIVNQAKSLGLSSTFLNTEVTNRAGSATDDDDVYALATMAHALNAESDSTNSTVPVGAKLQFEAGEDLIQQNGENWLRTGYAETDPNKFAPELATFLNVYPKDGRYLKNTSSRNGIDFYQGKLFFLSGTSTISVYEDNLFERDFFLSVGHHGDFVVDDAEHKIYAADYNVDIVRSFDMNGTHLADHTVAQNGETLNVYALAQNSTHFIVLDRTGNCRLLIHDLNWARVGEISLENKAPSAYRITADDEYVYLTNDFNNGLGNIVRVKLSDGSAIGTGDIKLGTTGGIALLGNELMVVSRSTNNNSAVRVFSKDLIGKHRFFNDPKNYYGICRVGNFYLATTGVEIIKHSLDGQVVDTITPPNKSGEIYGIAYKEGSDQIIIFGTGEATYFDLDLNILRTVPVPLPSGVSGGSIAYTAEWVGDDLYAAFHDAGSPTTENHVAVYDEFMTLKSQYKAPGNYIRGITHKNGKIILHSRIGSYYYLTRVTKAMEPISGDMTIRSDYSCLGNDSRDMIFDGDDLIVALGSRKTFEKYSPIYFAGSPSKLSGEAGPYYMRIL